MKTNLKPIAITQGDPAGIGPEIVAKAFRDAPDVLRGCFVVGNVATLRRAAGCIARPGIPSLPVAVTEGVADALDAPPRCVARKQTSAEPTAQEKEWYQGVIDQSIDSTVMHRYGTIEEQAAPILFFASDESSYITGSVLPVGGGDLG